MSSKDPAVLFYTSDFISGTLLMSDEQRGKYIILLCLQHQKGRLSEEDMIKICKTYDKDIFEKFKKDDDGFFYNERMKSETDKRRSYSESRRNNRKSLKNQENNLHMSDISKSYVKHMENENENENESKEKSGEKISKKIPPNLEDVKTYFSEKDVNSNEFERFFDYYESKNWFVGKSKMKDWKAAIRNWIRNMQEYSGKTIKPEILKPDTGFFFDYTFGNKGYEKTKKLDLRQLIKLKYPDIKKAIEFCRTKDVPEFDRKNDDSIINFMAEKVIERQDNINSEGLNSGLKEKIALIITNENLKTNL